MESSSDPRREGGTVRRAPERDDLDLARVIDQSRNPDPLVPLAAAALRPQAVIAIEPATTRDAEGGGWVRICSIADIPRLGARVVRPPGRGAIAVFRTANDRLFALADRCPHRGGPLSQGIVFGERVACPLHSACIELATGCAVAPDKGRVQRFDVKAEDGDVYLDLQGRPDVDD